MDATGSTSSIGTAGRASVRRVNIPRSVMSSAACESTRCVYSRKMSYRRVRGECCSRNTVSGVNRGGGAEVCVMRKEVVRPGGGGVLQPEHSVGGEQGWCDIPPPLVFATGAEP